MWRIRQTEGESVDLEFDSRAELRFDVFPNRSRNASSSVSSSICIGVYYLDGIKFLELARKAGLRFVLWIPSCFFLPSGPGHIERCLVAKSCIAGSTSSTFDRLLQVRPGQLILFVLGKINLPGGQNKGPSLMGVIILFWNYREARTPSGVRRWGPRTPSRKTDT